MLMIGLLLLIKDGRDADGDQLANGTYLYKVIVKSADGEFNKSVLGKLAVIK